MSQITTCPSCGTRFRVVADQLRISDGWVRCGQCQEVFDARNHLDAAPTAVPAAPTAATGPAAQAAAPPVPAVPAASIEPLQQAQHRDPPMPAAAVAEEADAVSERPLSPAAALAAKTRQAAPPPGYELPAPQWNDDIDFSEYQADPAEVWHHAPAPSAEGQPADTDDGAAAAKEPVDREEAVPAARAPGAFPALDLAVLQVAPWTPAPAASANAAAPALASPAAADTPVPGSEVEDVNEIGISSNIHGHKALTKNEQLTAPGHLPKAEPEAVFPAHSAAAAGAQGASVMAPSAASASSPLDAATAPAAAIVEPGEAIERPQDALESAAQKLAQAEAPMWDAAVAAPASPLLGERSDEAVPDAALEPSFVREARRKAWWQKPAVRVAMGAGVVVLPVALALQVALHERNALAAWQPSLRPALEFMCTALQCKLGPRQHIAAMVVSGSTFAKGDGERAYQLSLSIQNRARTAVGMPAVELTLTDTQDQAIARKVIAPKDLGAPQELKAGGEWSGALAVTTEGLNLQVAGYRVLLFYP